jgi:RNA polymerase sigma-70 factor (ECF subfamily)
VPLSRVADPGGGQDVDVLALHDALSELAALDQRQAHIVELRYFGGLKIEEIGVAVNVSESTVKRELTTATAWLRHRLRG